MRFLCFVFLGLACVEEPVEVVDTGELDPDCMDAQLVTYNNFGESFMTHSCQGCHASSAPNRFEAPEDISFDDLEAVWEQSDVILAVATGATPTMPPQGGVTELQRTKLIWWLRCGEPGL